MNFKDKKHKEFYEMMLNQIEEPKKSDAYYRSFFYTLGICPITRKRVNEIFDLPREEIRIDCLNKNWQTGKSKKVTQLAFNLWNDYKYEKNEDTEKNKISTDYTVSNIFGCTYAPYFYEAIKLRFPEYTKLNEEEEDM